DGVAAVHLLARRGAHVGVGVDLAVLVGRDQAGRQYRVSRVLDPRPRLVGNRRRAGLVRDRVEVGDIPVVDDHHGDQDVVAPGFQTRLALLGVDPDRVHQVGFAGVGALADALLGAEDLARLADVI